VATYLAKYVTKSVAEFGVGIRRMSPLAVAELDITGHVRAILNTITDMAARHAYHGMDRWLHTLGYRGHITTKSRLFSTTMGALRAYRAAWTRQRDSRQAAGTMDAEHDRATATIDAIEWEFDRVGLCSLGERALILSAAQRMIEHRHTARDNLRAHDPPLTGNRRHEHPAAGVVGGSGPASLVRRVRGRAAADGDDHPFY